MMAKLKHSDHKSSRFCSLKVNMRYIYNKGKSGESSTVVQSQDVNHFNTKATGTKLRNYFTLASFNLIVDTIK